MLPVSKFTLVVQLFPNSPLYVTIPPTVPLGALERKQTFRNPAEYCSLIPCHGFCKFLLIALSTPPILLTHLSTVQSRIMASLNTSPRQSRRGNFPKDCKKKVVGLIYKIQQRPHSYNNPGYLPNGATGGHTGLPPGAAPLLPNNGRVIQTGGVRVLCVADVRGWCE